MTRELLRRVVTVEGIRVSFSVAVSGDLEVVLLHGIPGSARTWTRVVECLPAGVRPIIPDLVGFGDSGRAFAIEELHAERQARLVREALRVLGVRQPLIVAHDFGGPVALRMMMQDPGACAGLLLAATNAFSDTPVPLPLSLVRLPVAGYVAERLLFSRLSLRMMCGRGARRGRVDTGPALGDAAQVSAIRTIFAGSLRDLPRLYGPIERSLAAIRVPTRVLWGDRDPFFDVAQGERLCAAIPGATFRLVEGCGHFLPDEAPDEVAEEVQALVNAAVSRPLKDPGPHSREPQTVPETTAGTNRRYLR